MLCFARFCQSLGLRLAEVVPVDLFDWVGWQTAGSRPRSGPVVAMVRHAGAAPASVNRRVAAVRALFEYQVVGIGWSGTALADGTAARYAAELVQLAGAITAYRYAEGALPSSGDGNGGGQGGNGGSAGGGRGSPKNGVVLICDCPRRTRVSTAVASIGPILCGVCSSEFTS